MIDEQTRRVLTLARLLEAARDYDQPVDLAIETKHPTRYAGLVERRLVDLLATVGWAGADSPARVMSFSPVALTRVKKLAPEPRGGAADRPAVLLADGHQRARSRVDRRPGHRPAAGEPQARPPAAQAGPPDPRLDGEHPDGPRPVRCRSGWRP